MKIAHSFVWEYEVDNDLKEDFNIFYSRICKMNEADVPFYGFHHAKDVDSLLEEYLKREDQPDYLLVTFGGVIFQRWYEYQRNVIKFIQRQDDDWLFAGHLIDRYEWAKFNHKEHLEHFFNQYYIFPITLIINFKKWKSIGSPKYTTDGGTIEIRKLKSSVENIHDNYTPLEVTWDQSARNIVKVKNDKGCGFIQASAEHNLRIQNIPQDIRNECINTYPDKSIDKWNNFWKAWQQVDPIHETNLVKAITHLAHKKDFSSNLEPWSYFVWNTETTWVWDNNTNDFSNKKYENIYNDCNTIVATASGFKAMELALVNKTNIKKIVHYDYHDEIIRFRRYLNNNWDGHFMSLKNILADQIPNNYTEDYEGKDNKMYTELINSFGGQDKFLEAWNVYKNLDHQYVVCNGLTEMYKVKYKLNEQDKALITFSDIAGFSFNAINFGRKNLLKKLRAGIDTLGSNIKYIEYKSPIDDMQYLDSIETFNQSMVEILDRHQQD